MGLGISPLILSFCFTVWRSEVLGHHKYMALVPGLDIGVLACYFPVDTMDEEFFLDYAIT